MCVIPKRSQRICCLEPITHYYVYIVSNKSRRLYKGITSNLGKRVSQHKNKLLDAFTARYNFDMLVYYEMFSQVDNVIACEKQIKSCRREKKLRLILAENPSWRDLSLEWEDGPSCPSRITMSLPAESQTD